MQIIGITGLIGAGKDEVANYMAKKYGYVILNMGDMFREIAEKEGLELTRDTFQNLRIKYGNFFIAEEVVKGVKQGKHKKIIIAGIRRSEDVTIPKQAFPDMKLIVVEADKKVRFERLKDRARENDPETFEEFERQMKREYDIYDFDKTFSMADFVIENNGSFEELFKKTEDIMKRIAE